MEISCDKQQYSPDEPITIEYRLINKGTKDITIDRDLYIYLAWGKQRKYTIEGISINLRDKKVMEDLLHARPLPPQKRDNFTTLPPGYFYGTTFVLSPKTVKVKGEISSSYRGFYDGHEFGLHAWTGMIEGNTINIKISGK